MKAQKRALARHQPGGLTGKNRPQSPSFFRKHTKNLIVWFAARGFIPPTFAEWILSKGGLAND